MQIELPQQEQMYRFEGCTYYGFREDRQIKALYPTPMCVCYAGKKPEEIDIAHQTRHCLSANYQACPVLMSTDNLEPAEDAVMTQRSHSRLKRTFPMLTWTVLLVCVLAMGNWVYLQIRPATVSQDEAPPAFVILEEVQPEAMEESSAPVEKRHISTQGEDVPEALPTPILTVVPTVLPTAVSVEVSSNDSEQVVLSPEPTVAARDARQFEAASRLQEMTLDDFAAVKAAAAKQRAETITAPVTSPVEQVLPTPEAPAITPTAVPETQSDSSSTGGSLR